MEQTVEMIEIVPSGGGVFEVTVDGESIYSKKQTKRHAEPGEVMGSLRAR